MEIAPYKPPLKLELDLNIILDVDTLNFNDYSYIYGQLNHIILEFEINGKLTQYDIEKDYDIDLGVNFEEMKIFQSKKSKM